MNHEEDENKMMRSGAEIMWGLSVGTVGSMMFSAGHPAQQLVWLAAPRLTYGLFSSISNVRRELRETSIRTRLEDDAETR